MAQALFAFNRGRISKLALARADLSRYALSADVQTNYVLRVLGSMMLRPGFEYVGQVKDNNLCRHIPFVFSRSDKAIMEFTDECLRIRIDDIILTRPVVLGSITNGLFTSDVSGWTDADESGATSSWATGGYLSLVGDGLAYAIRRQSITINAADAGKEHGIKVVIERGRVRFRVGTTAGDDDLFAEAVLEPGEHHLSFTPPATTAWIEFANQTKYAALVDSIEIETGDVEIATVYGADDLDNVRADQSADVVYLACRDKKQQKIVRRATRSWSIEDYLPQIGPWRAENTNEAVTITPSALNGDVTLTASQSLFRDGHVGALFRIRSTGQQVTRDVTAQNQYTDDIRVTGVGASRTFSILTEGTWSATVTVQRSVSEPGDWVTLGSVNITTNTTTTFRDVDRFDNQVVYYRVGVATGDYTSGTVEITVDYDSGGIDGVARIVSVTNATSAGAIVLQDFGGTDASPAWTESSWSGVRGYPAAVALHEGRLCWAGNDKVWLSVTDDFENFDDELEGDAASFSVQIGSGTIDTANYLVSLRRLILGTDSREFAVRSNTLDEPLTATNANIITISTYGSRPGVNAVRMDENCVFVQGSGQEVMRIGQTDRIGDYDTSDMTIYVPEIGEPSVTRLAVQRIPDTRFHAVRSDGTVGLLVQELPEAVQAWLDIETDGDIEDAFTMPGDNEDEVYYQVKRTVKGETVRYLERWALESQCKGGSLSRCADSHVTYSGAAKTTFSVAHLDGEQVVVWADGKDAGTYTVQSGQVILSEAASDVCIGLAYTAQFKSTKLGRIAAGGTSLTQPKKIQQLGVILADTHYQGVKYGNSFADMYDLPLVANGVPTPADTVWSEFDEPMFIFPGRWDVDARLCLQSQAPRPATILAATMDVVTNED